MKGLIQMVKVMKPGEVRLLRHFFELDSNAEEKKRAELFELVYQEKVDTDEKASKKLYGTKELSSAYSHLKSRLKHDIMNIFFLQDATKKYITPFARAEFECRRGFIQGFTLIGRGAYDEGVRVLKKAKKLAVEYELPAELVLIEQVLRSMTHRIKSEVALERYNSSIKAGIDLLADINRVEEYRYYFTYPKLFKTNKKVQDPRFQQGLMQELENIFEKTGSAKVGFWYYSIISEYYKDQKQYKDALRNDLKLLKLVENEPAIYSRLNWAGANYNVSSTLLKLHEYSRASGYARNAVKFFKSGGVNELIALELLFYVEIRNKNFQATGKIIEQAQEHPRISSRPFYPAIWKYFKANLEFINGLYDDAFDTLQEDTTLMKDKSGWLLGYRLLELLIMIEREEYDWLDYKLDNFRKLLQRQKKGNIARSKVIFSVLKTLEKNTYDFEETAADEAENIKLLKEAKGNLHWDPQGFEVIRFDEWLENKVKDYAIG